MLPGNLRAARTVRRPAGVLAAAINAGSFRPDYAPAGLLLAAALGDYVLVIASGTALPAGGPAAGCTAAQIARRLSISPRTVHFHLGALDQRLGAASLAARAAALGLLSLPSGLPE